ncbi:MAG: hypothetical protein U7127_15780 [Phormidium sp.]
MDIAIISITIFGAVGAILNTVVMIGSVMNLNREQKQENTNSDSIIKSSEKAQKVREAEAFMEESLKNKDESERKRILEGLRELVANTSPNGCT